MSLTYQEIAEIVKIIDASACDEVHVELPGVKLVVRRRVANGGGGGLAPAPASAAVLPAAAPPATAAPSAPPGAAARPTMPAARGDHLIEVRAPMVGTFYRAPSPEAPPFVEIGSVVTKDAPLCLIEVMKLFTTITAAQAGRIVEIGARNAELVQHDQVLFVIEPV